MFRCFLLGIRKRQDTALCSRSHSSLCLHQARLHADTSFERPNFFITAAHQTVTGRACDDGGGVSLYCWDGHVDFNFFYYIYLYIYFCIAVYVLGLGRWLARLLFFQSLRFVSFSSVPPIIFHYIHPISTFLLPYLYALRVLT